MSKFQTFEKIRRLTFVFASRVFSPWGFSAFKPGVLIKYKLYCFTSGTIKNRLDIVSRIYYFVAVTDAA